MFLEQEEITRSDLYGKHGEKIACKYLKQNGYKIIKKNFLCPLGEIDIIALDGDRIVFIEVKARSTLSFGYGREVVNDEKLRKIKNASVFFIKSHTKYGNNLRYDLIEIFGDEVTTHLKGII